jgi:Zn-dependent peptidase ImmA (M78 family)
MARSIEAAVRAAKKILKETPQKPPIDVEAIAAAFGLRVDYQFFEDSLSGMFVREHNIIAVNKRHARVRQRFTIAHELGHALLHAKQASLFVDDVQALRRDGSHSLEEVEANRFAAELLMPEESVRQLVKQRYDLYDEAFMNQLARLFDVSSQAFSTRLVSLRLVGDNL